MSWVRSRPLESVAIALLATVLAIGTLMLLRVGRIDYQPQPDAIAKPILALEFPDRPDHVTDVVLAGGRDQRIPIRAAQQLDAYFIPAYVALLVVLTLIAAANRRGPGRLIAVAAIVLAAAAGGFDYRENAAIDSMLRSVDPAIDGNVAPEDQVVAAQAILASSPTPRTVVAAASIKWTLLFLGGGLIGFLLMVRPYRFEPSRFVLAAAGTALLLSALMGVGLWLDPRVVGPASSVLGAGLLLLVGVAAVRPSVLADPDEPAASGEAHRHPLIGKPDHLLPLAAAALDSLDNDASQALREAFGQVLDEFTARATDVPASAREVPESVRLTLMADLLLRRPDDAVRLAREDWPRRARVIHELAGEVLRLHREDVSCRTGQGARAWILRMTSEAATVVADLQQILSAHGVPLADADRLREELLVNPDLAARVAERIGFAVPFNLALQAELAEVELSRTHRLDGGTTRSDSQARRPDGATRPVNLGALEAERRARLAAIRGGRAWYAPRRAAEADLVGLALSGGGIRSATFNLGVLQALASRDLLRRIDYLSTVSGGGYIGSWLVLWIRRIGQMTRRDGSDAAGTEPRCSVAAVERRLSPSASPEPNAPAVRPIRFLREFSNYLTPKRGLLGADTWTVIAVWFRNTLLIQSVLVLSLAGVLLLPRAVGQIEEWLTLKPPFYQWTAFSLGLMCFLAVSWRAGTELGRFERRDRHREEAEGETTWAPAAKAGVSMVQLTLIAPAFLCGLFMGGALFTWARRGWFLPDGLPGAAQSPIVSVGVGSGLLIGLGITIVAFRAGYALALVRQAPAWRARLKGAAVILLGIAAPAICGGALMAGVASLFDWWAATPEGPDPGVAAGPFHVASFGAPIIIEVLALALVLHIGLMGTALSDDRREWWSRLGAWLLIYSVVWMGLFGVAVYAPLGVALMGNWVAGMGGIAWVGSTAWGAYVAQSPDTAPATSAGGPPSRSWRDRIATLMPYVFVIGLLVLVAIANHAVLVSLDRGARGGLDMARWFADYWTFLTRQSASMTAVAAGGVLALALLLAWRVDINEFSMHHFYKNRLVRCYLGASREGDRSQRSPHPFTGFDAADDSPIASLRTDGRAVCRFTCPTDDVPDEPYVGPLPIVNTALNLVKGDDLAWQERRAQSFVFTPIFSGYEQLALTTASRRPHRSLAEDGLRPTCSYGYAHGGVHIGTAMSISGAAANPNMGYHSSPAAAFLMTMFNVRLGWWLGNPRHKGTWKTSSPVLGITYLVNELLGNTKNSSAFVNLSDGGHFENLGIYELVRRHCRLIIACDAEQDGDVTFNGLGNAVRKCRTDFGVEIDLQPRSIAAGGTAHFVVGEIRYPGGDLGRLIYLKSSLTGDEPADVLEYSRRQAKFPHESTADQFFDESQFESYRELGYHIGLEVLPEAFDTTGRRLPRLTVPAATVADASGPMAAMKQALDEAVSAKRTQVPPPDDDRSGSLDEEPS